MNSARVVLLLVLLLGVTASGECSAESPRPTVTDGAGSVVALPPDVARVAIVGAVPIISSFLLALGKGETIVSGVPPFSQTKRHKYLRALVPSIFERPVAQGPAADPNFEVLRAIRPDRVITMDRSVAELLDDEGFQTLVLTGREPEDVKATIALLGEVFEVRPRAERYIQYFDNTIKRIDAITAAIPNEQRPKVLFCSMKSMSRPHQTADWWIRKAGGLSVAGPELPMKNQGISLEQLVAWDPDVLVVNTQNEIDQVYSNERLKAIKAVQTKRVYTVPVGVHTWHRTVEQPLALLWAAKTFFPQQFVALDLMAETKRFYSEFFDYRLTDEQASEILSGIQ